MANQPVSRCLQQFNGRGIGQRYIQILVQPDHPGRNTTQNRFGEFTSSVDLFIGLHQLFTAAYNFIEHVVERQTKPCDFLKLQPLGHTRRQIACPHLFGNRNHRAQRLDNGGRQIKPDPQGGDQQQCQEQAEHKGKADLKIKLSYAKLLIIGGGKARIVDSLQYRAVDKATNKQIGIDKAV